MVLREMVDDSVLDLVEKHLVTDHISLHVSYGSMVPSHHGVPLATERVFLQARALDEGVLPELPLHSQHRLLACLRASDGRTPIAPASSCPSRRCAATTISSTQRRRFPNRAGRFPKLSWPGTAIPETGWPKRGCADARSTDRGR